MSARIFNLRCAVAFVFFFYGVFRVCHTLALARGTTVAADQMLSEFCAVNWVKRRPQNEASNGKWQRLTSEACILIANFRANSGRLGW